jgi:hypothetical protein
MRPVNYVINLVLSSVLIVGAYQFYFWCQHAYFGGDAHRPSSV